MLHSTGNANRLGEIKGIVRIGLPAGIQGSLFSISNVLIQSAVNSFGSTLIAANSASGNVEGLIGTTMNSYYNAAITFTGQNMGAKKYDRIDTIARFVQPDLLTWIVLGGVILLIGRPILGIYTSNPEVIELGMQRMKVMMAAYFTCGFMSVFPGLTRGMGYSITDALYPHRCLSNEDCLVCYIFKWYPTVIMLLFVSGNLGLAGIGQVASFLYARRQIRKEAAGPVVPKGSLKSVGYNMYIKLTG